VSVAAIALPRPAGSCFRDQESKYPNKLRLISLRLARTRASNAFDGVAGEVLYPSQGLFYFKVADTPPMSAIFRAYNDWLAEFCRTDPVRLKGIAMISLDDVPDGIKELELAARLGLSGAMITEYPLEHRRYDGSEYEPFWAAAAALDLPLSPHTATRRRGRIRGAGDKTLRDASSRATKAFYPALSMCDLIFSGRLRASSPPDPRHCGVRAGVGAPPALHHGLHLPRAARRGDLPVQGRHAAERLLPPQRRLELPGGRHRHPSARRHRPRQHDVGQHDVGLGLSAQRVDLSPIAEDPGGDPGRGAGRRQAKPAPDHDPGIAGGNTARVYNFDVARLTVPA